jgi:hypothetical protein
MPTIGAAVTEVTKTAFASAARTRHTTSSRLSASLIHEFLARENGNASTIAQASMLEPMANDGVACDETKTKQVFIRLEPYYYAELGRLAAEKLWPRSTYMANLFYAHADRRPVLCNTEIDALRQVARQMLEMGRNLKHVLRNQRNAVEPVRMVTYAEFKLLEILIESETNAVRSLIKANLLGWGVSDAST